MKLVIRVNLLALILFPSLARSHTAGPPFHGKSMYEVVEAHQSREAQALNVVRPEVPEDLAAVVRKMMAKKSAQRYQTPFEVVTTTLSRGTKRSGSKPPARSVSYSSRKRSCRSSPNRRSAIAS